MEEWRRTQSTALHDVVEEVAAVDVLKNDPVGGRTEVSCVEGG